MVIAYEISRLNECSADRQVRRPTSACPAGGDRQKHGHYIVFFMFLPCFCPAAVDLLPGKAPAYRPGHRIG